MRSAHTKPPPTETFCTSLNPVTLTGLEEDAAKLPLPSLPFPFDPQHRAVRSASATHTVPWPTETSDAGGKLDTNRGLEELGPEEPMPSSPFTL